MSIIAWIQLIMSLMVTVENALGAGKGSDKKAIVTAAADAAAPSVAAATAVSSVIDASATALQAAGQLLPHASK